MMPEYFVTNPVLMVGLWLLLPVLNPFSQWCRLLVLTPLVVVQIYYVWWRYTATLEPFVWQPGTVWMYAFYASEMIVVAYLIWQCITLMKHRDRREECDLLADRLASLSPVEVPSVDLYIPTYSEPPEILEATIKAAKKDSYPNLTIWICDDGRRSWLRELCQREQVKYISRPAHRSMATKAGNLNWSITRGTADYIVCLDADFHATENLTLRLTCFLADKEIGLVQAPQHFRNIDPIQRNLLGHSGWTEEQRFFFDIALPSHDAWSNAYCVGSCWATRREIITELNGFPTDSIVEDVYFGYRVKSLGYKTVYVNERLATGLAAEDTPSYIVQRSRWCMGAIALLRNRYGPLRVNGLTLTDRLFFLEIPVYWLTHLHLLMLLVAPSLYGFFGFIVFKCSIEEFLSVLVPKAILCAFVFFWISQGRCMPLVTPVQKMLPLFHTIPAMFRGLFFPHKLKFSVTPKDINYQQRTVHWRIAMPFLVIGLCTLVAMIKTLSQNFNQFDWDDYGAYNTLFGAYSLFFVLLCFLACVEKPENKHACESETPLTGNMLLASKSLMARVFT